jgi:hypothetical protein
MRSLFVLVFICCIVIARAQQTHFIYLQTDNRQPFYVKLNEKLFSSSAAGYLVIPKLPNGTHDLAVGFPKNEWPNQVIPVTVVNKDLGFMLKNFDSKGWGLFNMQSMDVIMANSGLKSPESVQAATRTDEFSNTLADVVNTPSIKELKKEEVKEKETVKVPEPARPVAESEIKGTANNTAASPVVESKVAETANNTPALPSAPADTMMVPSVSKISESKTADGMILKYSVQDDSKRDTVQVIILQEEVVGTKEGSKETPGETKPLEPAPAKETKPGEGTAPKFIDIELANPNTAKDSADMKPAKPEEKVTSKEKTIPSEAASEMKNSPTGDIAGLQMINSDCKSSATDEDFLKVRKKMIAQKDDNEMISAAQKLFRQKCYSTEQVKNLSVLFLKDDSKYKFFDAAYPFVYDTPNFKNLESQLTDPYFISRFKAMIRN